jgi:hypothetical protein
MSAEFLLLLLWILDTLTKIKKEDLPLHTNTRRMFLFYCILASHIFMLIVFLFHI